ncbi:Protein SABRE [Saitoella coloradoensis]
MFSFSNLVAIAIVFLILLPFSTFAILHTITGIKVRSYGYLSLRRVSFTTPVGIRLYVRSVGISLHRPTIARNTWISIVVTGIKVQLRPEHVAKHMKGRKSPDHVVVKKSAEEQLRILGEKLSKITKWINMVDVQIDNTSLEVIEVGTWQVGRLHVAAETSACNDGRKGFGIGNSGTRGRAHSLPGVSPCQSTVVTAMIQHVLVTPPDAYAEPVELFDMSLFTITISASADKGVTKVKLEARLTKLFVPLDCILHVLEEFKVRCLLEQDVSLSGTMHENPPKPPHPILQVTDEVHVYVGALEITTALAQLQPTGIPSRFTLSLKDAGLEFEKIPQTSAVHRMHFHPDTISHQAILTAVSIMVYGGPENQQDQLISVPLMTVACKTSMVSRWLGLGKLLDDPNTNLVTVNVVITNPSADLRLDHAPIFLSLLRIAKARKTGQVKSDEKPTLKSRIPSTLPRMSLNFTIHEPAMRVLLPSILRNTDGEDSFRDRALVSRQNNVVLDVEGAHTETGQYAMSTAIRWGIQRVYYRIDNATHDVIDFDGLLLRLRTESTEEPHVSVYSSIENLKVKLDHPDTVACLTEIAHVLDKHVVPTKVVSVLDTLRLPNRLKEKRFFLRNLPEWLHDIRVEGKDVQVALADVEKAISEDAKGTGLQIDSWVADYRVGPHTHKHHHKTLDASINPPLQDDSGPSPAKPQTPHAKDSDLHDEDHRDNEDEQRMTIVVRALRVLTIDSQKKWDRDEPLLAVPAIHISMSTASDEESDYGKIRLNVKQADLGYSLNKHYTLLQAINVLRKAAAMSPPAIQRQREDKTVQQEQRVQHKEPILIDAKVHSLRLRASLPLGRRAMIEVANLEFAKPRWGTPTTKARFVRGFVPNPILKTAWDRVFSLSQVKVEQKYAKSTSQNGDIHSASSKSFILRSDAIRLRIPDRFVLHELIESIINAAKAGKQLQHRFITGSNDYILQPHAEDAKHVPRVRVKSRVTSLILEDDPFESRLGLIWRVGLIEQKARLARDAAFEAKCSKIREEDEKRKARSDAHKRAHFEGQDIDKVSQKTDSSTLADLECAVDAAAEHVEQDAASTDSSVEVADRPQLQPRDTSTSLRYNPETAPEISSSARVDMATAERNLQEHNSNAWIKRFKWANETRSAKMVALRQKVWGHDDLITHHSGARERILPLPQRPPLMSVVLMDLDFTIDKPSFPPSYLPSFLHDVGKGLPSDTQFSLLIPLSVRWEMSEARVNLRDYPLPLIHIQAPSTNRTSKMPTFSLQADFVIAEELANFESTRHVDVTVIPANKGRKGSPSFKMTIPRTSNPPKTYSTINIDINSDLPTRIAWGTSLQPAISDAMKVFESFTKPQTDVSEKLGFWDKIRLVLHSRMRLNWGKAGDVHFTLKGTRDPYIITGDGAGFLFCWRGETACQIACDPEPRNLLQIESEEFMLAIPDYTKDVFDNPVAAASGDRKVRADQALSEASLKHNDMFQKIVMKLTGRVKWTAGLTFERHCPPDCKDCEGQNKCRLYTFKPHYDVVMKIPQYSILKNGTVMDAFAGFRSNFLHGQLSVTCPSRTEDTNLTGVGGKPAINSIHLTPRVFSHFFSWIHTFSSALNLPCRQGSLFPNPEKSGKKFGAYLATLKYKLELSPLFLSHIYKHKDSRDWEQGTLTATGIKGRIERFSMDMHQRREEHVDQAKDQEKEKKSHMSVNLAEINFIDTDLRAILATAQEYSAKDLHVMRTTQEQPEADHVVLENPACLDLPTENREWVDMNDFVELDYVLPQKKPECIIMPLAFTPRFTYYRETDPSEHSHGKSRGPHDASRITKSRFNDEATHDCAMQGIGKNYLAAQLKLAKNRENEISQLIKKNADYLEKIEGQIAATPYKDVAPLIKQSEELVQQSALLYDKRNFMSALTQILIEHFERGNFEADDEISEVLEEQAKKEGPTNLNDPRLQRLELSPLDDPFHDFSNRFVVHNVQLKWYNAVRNALLSYIHEVGQRRGFIYYMSQRAVQFISNLVEEQREKSESVVGAEEGELKHGNEEERATEDLIRQLLEDADQHFVVKDEKSTVKPPKRRDSIAPQQSPRDGRYEWIEDLPDGVGARSQYTVSLIAPQIQLQSEKNDDSAVIVTTQAIRLNIFNLMDKDNFDDDVNGLIQQRFMFSMDNAQFFVAQRKDFMGKIGDLLSANKYGTNENSSWPPWVPLETMFDFVNSPTAFARIVDQTSASCTYSKYNHLRLKYNSSVEDDVENRTRYGLGETERSNSCSVNFPKFVVSADARQYRALYVIITDLLMYTEPLQKERTERLERILIAADFSDMRGAVGMVKKLQERIHQLLEIKTQFKIQAENLDEQGCNDQVAVEAEIHDCQEELFFLMKTIIASQHMLEDHESMANSAMRWFLSASEVIWHMNQDDGTPMLDVGLSHATFKRVDNTDNSNFNTLEIEMMQAINLMPGARYTEMVAPYFGETSTVLDARRSKMLRVYWYMLEAIGGISVMDHFELNLFPISVQLEHSVGKNVFAYFIPEDMDEDEAGDLDADDVERTAELVTQDEENPPETNLPKRNRTLSSGSSGAPRPSSSSSRISQFTTASDGTNGIIRVGPLHQNLRVSPSRESLATTSTSSDHSEHSAESSGKKRFWQRNAVSADRVEAEDDLSQMMSRASQNMTLVYVKVPSTVLCLSYKGPKRTNIEDVENFVFKMPTVEFRNKTWSFVELAVHLKREVLKAVLQHTGSLIAEKFTKHKSGKHHPSRSRTRQLSSYQSFTPISALSTDEDDAELTNTDMVQKRLLRSGSTALTRPSTLREEVEPEDEESTGSSSSPVHSVPSSVRPPMAENERLQLGTNGLLDEEKSHSLLPHAFGNSIGRHLAHLSHLARHRDGIAEENEESRLKKTKMLLGNGAMGKAKVAAVPAKTSAVPGKSSTAVSTTKKGAKGKQNEEQPPTPVVKPTLVAPASWTGKLPGALLHEHCQKLGWNKVNYDMSHKSSGFTATVVLSNINPKTRLPETIRLHPDADLVSAQPTAVEARHMSATYALHRVSSHKSLQHALPPNHRKLWSDMETKRKIDVKEGHGWKYSPDPFQTQRERAASIQPLSGGSVSAKNVQQGGSQSTGKEVASPAPNSRKGQWDPSRTPAVEMSGDVRQRVEGLIRNYHTWSGGPPPNEAQLVERFVVDMGWRKTHVEEACEYAADAEELLEWLLIHVPEDDLPPRFFPPKYTAGGISVGQNTADGLIQETTAKRLSQGGYQLDQCRLALASSNGDECQAAETLFRNLVGYPAPEAQAVSSDLWSEEAISLEAIYAERFLMTTTSWKVSLSTVTGTDGSISVTMYPSSSYPMEPPALFLHAAQLPAHIRLAIARQVGLYAVENLVGDMMCYAIVEWIEENMQTIIDNPGKLVEVSGGITGFNEATNASVTKKRKGRLRRVVRPNVQSISSVDSALSRRLKEAWQARCATREYQAMLSARQKLPAYLQRDHIVQTIMTHRVTLVTGETGSGKSTQVIQFLLDHLLASGQGEGASMVCTQPRRISALGLAERVAAERAVSVGSEVGYAIRGDSKWGQDTKIKFVTTGVVLRWMQTADGELDGVSHIILDEVHERSVDSDFLLVILKELVKRRRDLTVVLMSATVNADVFAQYFSEIGPVGRCHIEGRTFPVEDYYLEDLVKAMDYRPTNVSMRGGARRREEEGPDEFEEGDFDENVRNLLKTIGDRVDYDLIAKAVQHIDENLGDNKGGILIFMSGTMEISRAIDAISSLPSRGRYHIMPLHAALPPAEQKRVFPHAPPGQRKIIVSTNVAETSITIDDIVVVLDSGRVKETVFDPQDNMVRLVETWASRAACKQRRGRAGRVTQGKCYKLFTRRTEKRKMLEQSLPEIARTPLEQLCLSVLAMDVEDVKGFLLKALTPPSVSAMDRALVTLREVGAVHDDREELTALGRHMSMIPADLRCAKLLILASIFGLLDVALTIAAILTVRSPFLSPADRRDEAKESRLAFSNGSGDHLTDVTAFNTWNDMRRSTSTREVRLWCEKNFLSQPTLFDIASTRLQYLSALRETGFLPFSRDAVSSFSVNSGNLALVRAVVAAATYPNIARIQLPDRKYQAISAGAIEVDPEAKAIKFFSRDEGRVFLHPSSTLFSAQTFKDLFLAYFNKQATSKVFLRDATPVGAYAVLFFGGNLEIDVNGRGITVGRWARIKAWARIGVLVGRLRGMLDDLLERRIDDPTAEKKMDIELLACLTQLLQSNGL